ncbi:MAG: hypothetical protein A2848_01595 [Candidatus Magasanikbacteria bacterium RIFCSPHIGHO2_01_FULL_50_8]|uniref:Uncharacterized protein n=1 Tax=Candidatus Magasanikbacteria bacterium RIFCSPHIGHO2_01_FULL_50_8 TaxID=1798674 RepID=A0A1F6LRI2_9BACT|nr:MAG: hypothetical protein A2848_01595 [Candidatus Magasanikbacteria bacterium RIFCSPHIGHO2_01_FULL_50_8]
MFKRIVHFIVHLIVVLAVSWLLAMYTTGHQLEWGFATTIILGILFGLLATFFVTNAIARYNKLSDAVSIELNKLRRIHHLARAFSRSENQIPWFDLVREAIESYLHAFEVIPFQRYDDTNEMFRRITQQLYGFDKLVSEKGKLLFAELMTISGQATEARQKIHELRNERIGVWSWGVLGFVGVALGSITLFSYGDGLVDRYIAGAMIAVVLLLLDFVYMTDTMKVLDNKRFTKRYVDNIERMGFWPEEKMK